MSRAAKSATSVLMVLGFAVLLAIVVWRSVREDDGEHEADDAAPSAESEPELAEDTPAEQGGRELDREVADDDEPAVAPAAPSTTPSAAGTTPVTSEPDAAPFEPEVREHAKQMILPSTSLAISNRDVKHLYELLALVRAHRAEQLMSETDIGAVEAAIACIERAPDAREEAEDLLRFGAPTELAESVRKVCTSR